MLDIRRISSAAAALTLGLFSLFAGSAAFAARSAPERNLTPQQLAAMSVPELQQQLAPGGWRVERDASGDLLLYPATTSAGPDRGPTLIAHSEAGAGNAVDHSPAPAAGMHEAVVSTQEHDRIASYSIAGLCRQRETLLQRGWDVKTNKAGDLLLFPRA